MDDHDLIFFGKIHNLLKKIQIHDFGGRVVRIADNQQFGTRPGLTRGIHQVLEKILTRAHRHAAHIAAGNDGRVRVDGIGRIGREHHISGPDGHEHQVGHPLLDADGDDSLGVRVYGYVESAFIPVRNGVAQFGNSHRSRIAMILGFLDGFDQFLDNMIGSAEIRVAHAQVDDVLPFSPGLHFDFVDFCKDIRWQPV